MQIALTKKLATAMGINPPTMIEGEEASIFSWTANWTKVWDNRRTEDMLVLVNNATRFTVAIYEVRKKSLKNVDEMMKRAIENTLLAMNLDEELVKEYMRLAGEVEFVKNSSRQRSSWVSKAGESCSFYVAREYNGIENMYSDTVGVSTNRMIVGYSNNHKDAFYPYKAMINELIKVTGKKAYNYTAFQLEIVLDLHIYKAVRKVIVPANISFYDLHKVIQEVFNWKDYHLYNFTIFRNKNKRDYERVVPCEESLEYDDRAILMEGLSLDEYMNEKDSMIYTYDMGDYWEHKVTIKKVINNYSEESPYLLEAKGQTPPEDVGGVGGFLRFLEIMRNPRDEEHEDMVEWAGYWSLELRDFDKKPRVIEV